MTGDTEIDAAIAAAEKSAGAGDFPAAERHLRDAVLLQETRLGPVHPDLANTLNNLGVACEQAGKLDEAEACYRRAYTIALEAFPPNHPFVDRSAANLRDFCEARGRPFDLPVPAPSAAAPPLPEPPVAAPIVEQVPSFEPVLATTAQPGPSRWMWPALLAVVVMAGLAWWMGRSPDTEPAAVAGETRAASSPGAPDPGSAPASDSASDLASDAGPDMAAEPGSATPADPASDPGPDGEAPAAGRSASESSSLSTSSAPAQTPAARAPADPAPAAGASPPPNAAPSPAPAPPRGGAVAGDADTPVVVRADVCRSFSTRSAGGDWSCDVVTGETAAGRLVFYTRIRSPRAVTIEHLWYRGTTLYQRVPLRVGANPGAGYRTYSQNTVPANLGGDWHVELRTAGGALLHEHHFTVR